MYISWKRKLLRRATGFNPERVSFRAHVMESHWINGKCEKKTVVYLGAIRQKNLSVPEETIGYWENVERKLACFVKSPKVREKLRLEIEKVVPNHRKELSLLCRRILKNYGGNKTSVNSDCTQNSNQNDNKPINQIKRRNSMKRDLSHISKIPSRYVALLHDPQEHFQTIIMKESYSDKALVAIVYLNTEDTRELIDFRPAGTIEVGDMRISLSIQLSPVAYERLLASGMDDRKIERLCEDWTRRFYPALNA